MVNSLFNVFNQGMKGLRSCMKGGFYLVVRALYFSLRELLLHGLRFHTERGLL